MDRAWWLWTPRHMPKDEPVTPESFNASLWHLADGEGESTTPADKSGPPSAQELNFQEAPASVRKAWIDSDQDPLHPPRTPQVESPFSFANVNNSK